MTRALGQGLSCLLPSVTATHSAHRPICPAASQLLLRSQARCMGIYCCREQARSRDAQHIVHLLVRATESKAGPWARGNEPVNVAKRQRWGPRAQVRTEGLPTRCLCRARHAPPPEGRPRPTGVWGEFSHYCHKRRPSPAPCPHKLSLDSTTVS